MQLAPSLAQFILSSDLDSCLAEQEIFLRDLDPTQSFAVKPEVRKHIFLSLLESIASEDTAKVTFTDLLEQKLNVTEWLMILSSQKSTILLRIPFIFKQADLASRAAQEIEMVYGQIFLHLLRSYEVAFNSEQTERIQNEEKIHFYYEQLTRREKELTQLIRHAPDAIIVINSESFITLWNPKAEEIFGWTSDEVMGRHLSETIVPELYRSAHEAGMKRYLATREAHVLNKSIEITALNKTGEEFMISLTISHFEQSGEDIFVAFLRNIEEQKRNEKELHKKRMELTQSNEELEQYAWLTSHDLREPLRKILTYSDMILSHEAEVPATIREKLEKISASATRMGKLIKAMLTYSGISDETQLYQVTSLTEVVHEVMADLELTIQESETEIMMEELPEIEAIPHQMRQLFQNIISNAIKYSQPHLSPRIVIGTKNIDANHIAIVVSDNGIGFDSRDEEKIFMLFHRLNTMEKKQGTDIGLALCKKIVLNHGGRISVASEPGVGTTFTITLPFKHIY